MSRNVNVSDGRFNQTELGAPLTVAAGGSFVDYESKINIKNENQGLKVDGQDELVIRIAVTGTMPVDSEIVITPIVHNFPDLDDITLLLPTVTDDKLEARLDSTDEIRDADFLKITYRFKQGGADYDVTALSLQVKKKPSIDGGGGGAALGSSWVFDAVTADADPGSGKFRLNNATQPSSTFIYVNDNSDPGVNLGAVLLCLQSGDRIYIQDNVDPTKFHLCNVTGNPTDATTYVKIPITITDSGADLTDTNLCDFEILFCSGVTTHSLGGAEHSADTLANLNTKVSDATLDDSGDPRTPSAHNLGGAEHSADTLANLNSKVSDATLDDSSDPRTPSAHNLGGAEHSADTLANLNSKVSDATLDDSSDPRTPSAHNLGGAEHSADTLANLNTKVSDATLDDSGDPRTPSAHNLGGAEHSADTLANLNTKVSDATLDDSGDPRTPSAHNLGGAEHSADTLANLNSKVSDATLDDSGDPRTPSAHNLGGAEHSADTLANLNTKVSDATLDDSGDPRDPNTHDLAGADHNSATLAQLNAKISDDAITGKAIYDANTMLKADSDNTPSALTVNASTVVGRKATGPIAAMSPGETKTVLSLNNVTNDAQLKRAAGDIATFTEKTTPVSADLLLIEDSAATNAKKRVQIGNLPGGGAASDQPAFSSRKSGDQTLTGSYADATGWNTPDEITSDFSFNTTTGVITINTAGLYFVHYALMTDITVGTARSSSRAKLQLNGGGGYSDIPSSEQGLYNRNLTAGKTNAAWGVPISLDVGDLIKLQVYQDSGTDTIILESNSTVLNLIKLQGAKGDAGPVYTHGDVTRAQMLAISSPTAGDTCFCTTYNKPFVYNGATWQVSGETMQLTNEAAGTFAEGDICILDTLNDEAVNVTTTANNQGVVGIVVIGGANGAEITIAYSGIWDVDFGAATTRGYFVQTSTTAGQAMQVLGGDSGTIGVVIEAIGGAGLAKCWLSGKEAY